MTKPQAEAERVWVQDNCPYCHRQVGEKLEQYVGEYRDPRLGKIIGADYCGMCGRKLNE